MKERLLLFYFDFLGEELLRMEMITCVDSPRSVEAGVRYFTPSASQGNDVHAVVHVGSREFLLSPRKFCIYLTGADLYVKFYSLLAFISTVFYLCCLNE